MNQTDPRSTQGILSRGSNVYGMSNAAPGAGRPREQAIPAMNVQVPKMAELNLSGAIERRLRGHFAPKSTAVPQATNR